MNRQPRWYWHRLRAMSPEEMIVRSRLLLKKQSWRRRRVWPAPTPSLVRQDSWTLPNSVRDLEQESREVETEAERYLRGEYRMLNLSFQEQPVDWHRDPQTGRCAPMGFGPDLDVLNTALVGNIKYLWEKNRHHHLTVLALAYALTRQRRFADAVAEQLEHWVNHNPFPLGVNWASSLELGVRLISWVWIERLLRGSAVHSSLFGPQGTLWPSIYWHQWMIGENHSHGSSANNHLVGEMAGLFIASSVWPAFDRSSRWQNLSRRTLEREILKQTFPSGIGRELAFGYHMFTSELFLLAQAEALRERASFSDAYRNRLARMVEAVADLTDAGGNLPRFGDSDDGMAVQLQAINQRQDDWLCRVGTDLLGARVPTPRAGTLAATIIVGNRSGAPLGGTGRGPADFEDAGLYVLTSNRATAQEVFVLADAGPLGYLSTAAHGHADALSFTLAVGGKPILIDPGTYDYLMEPYWRTYFRGTRAHNTVVVDDLDQSIQAGPFLWAQQARASVRAWNLTGSGATLVASHAGYARIGVVHQRCLELRGNQLRVLDDLRGTGTHRITLCFHAAPECRVEKASPVMLTISRGKVGARLTLPEGWKAELVRGGEMAGWYSSGYGCREETVSILAHRHGPLPATFQTIIEVHHEN